MSPNIGPQTIVARVEGLVSTEMDGETVLLSVESGHYYGMDPVGSRIWALIEEPRTVSNLCRALTEEYEVEGEQCQRDVIQYLVKLIRENLVKAVDEPVD
ncbi:MAG: lasso peptide biosynthesis PqqD family chaperone [Proteobacteria bacterium]|nr:lasso peptide biosynthesis PqqD family chaperone [Pseudomonadota bacterium]MBU1741411.1 lasso peptide biosynthesis PqqD family chaperone [Pseudomonadota bacterium]